MFGDKFRDVTLTDEQHQEVKAAMDALHAVCEKYSVPMACVVAGEQRVTQEKLYQNVLCTGTFISANPITLIVGALSQGRTDMALVKLLEYVDAERESRA